MNAKNRKGIGARMLRGVLALSGAASLWCVMVLPSYAQAQISATRPQSASAGARPSSSVSTAASAGAAQNPSEQGVQRDARSLASKGEESGKGLGTGIMVHGHWVIDILNPNGERASHTEFENSLQAGGQSALAEVLGQQAIFGGWAISFSGVGQCTNLASPTLFGIGGGGGGFVAGTCGLIQTNEFAGTQQPIPTSTQCGAQFVSGCIGPLPAPVTGPASILLAGSFVFPNTTPSGSNISQVETEVYTCADGVLESACVTSLTPGVVFAPFPIFQVFTAANLPSPPAPIPVTAGQIAQISVTLSFN